MDYRYFIIWSVDYLKFIKAREIIKKKKIVLIIIICLKHSNSTNTAGSFIYCSAIIYIISELRNEIKSIHFYKTEDVV